MGAFIKKTLAFSAFILLFPACDIFEFRGFVIPYETVDQRFEQSMAWNAEHPYKNISLAQDSYELFVMGDSHVGDTVNLNIFLDAAINAEAAAAVMVGDITTGNEEHFYVFERQLPAENILPTFLLAGNHDLYFHGWEHFFELFGASIYLFTVQTPNDSDLYICLDNAAATMGRKQLDWLKTTLENERPKYRHCILFTHTNIFRIRRMIATNPFMEELQYLSELCLRHNVNMLISGHDHTRNTGKLGNTEYLILDVLRDGEKNASYLILNIESDSISYNFVEL